MGWQDDPEVPPTLAPWVNDVEVTPLRVAPRVPGKVSFGEALLRGGGQGVTAGFGDEVNGFIQATGAKLLPESLGGDGASSKGKSFWDLYRRNRDTFRGEDQNAEAQHGGAYLVGNVLGGAALTPLLPGGSAATLGNLVKGGAALGAVGGLGNSEADLTRGEVGRAGFDTAVGGTVGALAGGGGYLLNKGLGWAGQKLLSKATLRASAADAKKLEIAKAAIEEANLARRSNAGRKAQEAYKPALELRRGDKIKLLDPEKRAAAERLLAEYDKKAAESLVSGEAAKTAATKAYAEGLAGTEQATAEKAAELGKSTIKKDAWELFRMYGEPAIGAYAGHEIGNKMGGHGGIGGSLGALGGLLMGRTRAGKAITTRWARPGNQLALAGAQKMLGGLLGRSAFPSAAVESAAFRSPDALNALEQRLMLQNPGLAGLFDVSPEDRSQALVEALRNRQNGDFEL